jgi:hypothetical protein
MARRINSENGGLILFGYRRCQGIVYAPSGGRYWALLERDLFRLIPMLLESVQALV